MLYKFCLHVNGLLFGNLMLIRQLPISRINRQVQLLLANSICIGSFLVLAILFALVLLPCTMSSHTRLLTHAFISINQIGTLKGFEWQFCNLDYFIRKACNFVLKKS